MAVSVLTLTPPPTPAAPRLLWCGETAFAIEFGDTIDPVLNALVLDLDARIAADPPMGLVETVPTYRSLLIHCDPLATDPAMLAQSMMDLARQALEQQALEQRAFGQESAARRWRVPVVYGGDFGVDLAALAARHSLPQTQVIERHARAIYRVYMIGFMPGFSYLGGLDPMLATPRMSEPRALTPAGSIAIGGAQTAISSVEAPSAWHLIGRTPAILFSPDLVPPVPMRAGDEVMFQPIAPDRFEALSKQAMGGEPVIERVRA